MTENLNRRTVVRGAAWTTPVVAAMAAAPAFAASSLLCTPTAECKCPGEGENTKDYLLRPACQSGTVSAVSVYDEVAKRWGTGTLYDTNTWLVRGLNDSRRNRRVRITSTTGETREYSIPFAPCKD